MLREGQEGGARGDLRMLGDFQRVLVGALGNCRGFLLYPFNEVLRV